MGRDAPTAALLRLEHGSKEKKTSISEECREATNMIVITQDNRPAALTLWPSSELLLITQTKLLWAVSGDVSNTKRQSGARRLQETATGIDKNPTHYSISNTRARAKDGTLK